MGITKKPFLKIKELKNPNGDSIINPEMLQGIDKNIENMSIGEEGT